MISFRLLRSSSSSLRVRCPILFKAVAVVIVDDDDDYDDDEGVALSL